MWQIEYLAWTLFGVVFVVALRNDFDADADDIDVESDYDSD